MPCLFHVPKCGIHLNGDSVRGEGCVIAAKRGTGPPAGSKDYYYYVMYIYSVTLLILRLKYYVPRIIIYLKKVSTISPVSSRPVCIFPYLVCIIIVQCLIGTKLL